MALPPAAANIVRSRGGVLVVRPAPSMYNYRNQPLSRRARCVTSKNWMEAADSISGHVYLEHPVTGESRWKATAHNKV